MLPPPLAGEGKLAAAGHQHTEWVEEPLGASAGECLCIERPVWVGARSGRTHLRDPLPVSMVADTCAFRPAVLAALHEHGRAWRTMFENGSIEATTAMVRHDLAFTAWLAFTVPGDLEILPSGVGLPALPPFSVKLHLARGEGPRAVVELARFVRDGVVRVERVG